MPLQERSGSYANLIIFSLYCIRVSAGVQPTSAEPTYSPPIIHFDVDQASVHYSEAASSFSLDSSPCGLAPTIVSTFSPFLKNKKVGIAVTPRSCASSGSSSTSNLTKWTCSSFSSASSLEYLFHEATC